MSISSILNIAKTAMIATQTSLQVTSNNIANVDTDGYTRQEVILGEARSILTENGALGSGVSANGVIQHYNKYLEKAIASKNSDLEGQKTLQGYFGRIEALLEESSSNLSSNIDDFFNGWQELSTDPTSVSARTTVAAAGENLSRGIRNLYGDLKGLQMELDSTIGSEINHINGMLSSIADLNQQIFESSSNSTDGAPDLLDKRAELFKELSGEIDVTSIEDKYGRLTVSTGNGGNTLVDGNKYWNLKTIDDEATGFNRIAWEDQSGNLTDITDRIKSGKLKALVDMRDKHIGNGFLNDVDELAKSIITETNTIHETGYNLNGTTGISFFSDITGNYAKNIDVNDQIKDDVKNIAAASSTLNSTDNDIVLSIAALVDKKVTINGSSSTFSDYVSAMENKIGELAKNAKALSEYQQSTMDALVSQRESISGVSVDEEMMNLLKFQHAYQAAAKLYNVADQLFQALIGMVSR
ncbi:MAG: flagellar hook-associated protein FlgK [Proteobacteria bacterium]|nr:flagellar hook-associated protein FlgK [Pseudomonadota bacterium]